MDEALYREWRKTNAALSYAIADLRYELACRRFVAELRRAESKANFNPAQARAPRGSPIGGEWIDAGGGGRESGANRASSLGFIRVQYRQPGGGGGGRRPAGPRSDPLATFRLETYNRAQNDIRRLEPANPQLQTLTPPNYVPDARTVNRSSQELEAARDRAAVRIARHAFEQGHGNRSFGGAGEFELNTIARRTISNPNVDVARISGGRTIYYNRSENTLVIVNTVEPQRSTMFRPDKGQRYVDALKRQ